MSTPDEGSSIPQNNKHDERTPRAQMSKIARGEDQIPIIPQTQQNGGQSEGSNLPVVRSPQNIIQSSEQAWIEGTQGLQKNLIRALQDYQTGWSGWKEKGLLSQKRQEMIREVTEHYIRFLREEARITSDAAFEARKAVLQKQLLELKAEIYKDIADMAGESLINIEGIFQEHYAKMTDPLIQQSYAQFVMNRIVDLLDIQHIK